MFNPWKRKVKRENKAAQILASVESNPQGDNLLKHIIKEHLPANNNITKRDDLDIKDFSTSSIVKIENTLFDDADESFDSECIANGSELNESVDSITSLISKADSVSSKNQNYPKQLNDNHVDKRSTDDVQTSDNDLGKMNETTSGHDGGKGLGQNSGSQATKKGTIKSVVRDNKSHRIQKWTRSSEDSFEQELALAIKHSLKDSQSSDQFEEIIKQATPAAAEMDCDENMECGGKLQLTYRTQCIDNYCHICEEMYLGHSLLELPQITYKKLASFDCVDRKQVVMSWNRIWTGYKLLCSQYRKNQVIDLWGPKEVVLFELAIFRLGKEFYKLHQLIPTKSVGEIVDFYYIWKKTRRYHLWKQVRHLTFEALETEDICKDLFQKTCSSTSLTSIESSDKGNMPNSMGSCIASAVCKRPRVDVKYKPKK
ncbi:hypothetical protein BMR1_03g04620 [Babesia microti strain RI]|uniref:SANT domain-containing protein n=1 Tax=Babesia microti (strain RI) TaxID=1133968 RepID=A0A0K3APW2_BABMR|nr:hypothetical protein BMR1_03g04620 [Babesia microti strain RI]CTQ41522.1 hypothetical protein BMR1_03g04620 [Babesia microti strain RI]|eukprot:XP_012649533.1 hypothetical protein BMR1_03g04620 [Babesia microti strain RI]